MGEKRFDEKIIIVRNNIDINEFLKFVNGSIKKDLLSKNKYNKLFEKYKELYFTYGDGGGVVDLPRFVCLNNENITHIINGIGEIKNDTVIVLNDS